MVRRIVLKPFDVSMRVLAIHRRVFGVAVPKPLCGIVPAGAASAGATVMTATAVPTSGSMIPTTAGVALLAVTASARVASLVGGMTSALSTSASAAMLTPATAVMGQAAAVATPDKAVQRIRRIQVILVGLPVEPVDPHHVLSLGNLVLLEEPFILFVVRVAERYAEDLSGPWVLVFGRDLEWTQTGPVEIRSRSMTGAGIPDAGAGQDAERRDECRYM
jgi:hypothetical protein